MKLRTLAALGCAGIAGLSITLAQPKLIVVEGPKFDLGTVFRGMVIEHQLTLKNAGTEALHLGPVEASCGCTGAIVSNENLRPGESGSLAITFNSKNFTGQVHKTVTVRTTPSTTPPLLIEFTATIVDEIVVTPQQFWFKDAEVGKKCRMVLTVTNNGKEPLRLTGWRSQLAGFTLTLPTAPIDTGKSAEVVAELTPEKAAPIISDAVFLTTSNPHRPELYLAVYGNVREFKFE
jgi:hypothetical protein